MAASSPLSTLTQRTLRAPPPAGAAHLLVVGTRTKAERASPVERKLDGMLSDLSRHGALARAEHVLWDLHSLSPAARFKRSTATGEPLVLIDANTLGDPRQLEAALVSLGLEHPAVYSNDVGGWLPVAQVEAAAARSEVHSIRAAMPHTRAAGPVATQGDYVQRSAALRTTYPSLTGEGLTVGVLSDSFNCYAQYALPGSGVSASGTQGYASNGFTADYASDESTDALPAGVSVIKEAECLDYEYYDSNKQQLALPLTDEGRAMLQIVHAVAPGASLAFYTGNDSEADFASGIGKLAAAGAKVIADDLGYFDEPFYEDGILAQAIDAVEAQGVAYFSAAGNDGMTPSYQNTAPSFGPVQTSGPYEGEALLNFDPTGATTTTALPITIPPLSPGDLVAVVVEWDQPYMTGCTAATASSCGASNQLDVCISGGTGADVITNYDGTVEACSGANSVGSDPYQVMIIANPATAAVPTAQQNLNIVIGWVSGAAPGRIIVSVEDDGQGSTINQFSPSGPTIQGHPGAAGAAAVGAAFYFDTPACGTTPATLEPYSAAGGAPILFNTDGTRIALPVPMARQKPNFVGPDGVNDTFLGYTLASASPPFPANGLLTTNTAECQNKPSYPNFFGTSAATPHAAGIATLIMQANSTATPAQIYSAMQASALAMTGATPNYQSGYGFIQADAALARIPPGAPTLTLGASSVVAGSSTKITWSSINASDCTASGSWSGALAASGSESVTPTPPGTATYSLSCANSAGSSSTRSVNLTVTADSPGGGGGGGGGGAIDGSSLVSLIGLTLLGAARRRGSRRPRRPAS